MVEQNENLGKPDSSFDAGSDEEQSKPFSIDLSEGDQEASADDAAIDTYQALQAQRDQMEANLLRVSADYQNFVRRSGQNTENACRQQLLEMTKALLTPLDHFDHALAVDPEKTSSESLVQGVQMVRDELAKVLEQFGIRRMDVGVGDPFDPVCHEAIQRVAVEGLESGVIAEQVQPGYLLGDKTVRPAKVVVAQ